MVFVPIVEVPAAANSPRTNSHRLVPTMNVDWVMEPEVPSSPLRFLDWPTRRAFMQDDVQIRIQIQHLEISASAKVSIALYEQDPGDDDEERLIHSYSASGDAPAGHPDASDFRRGARQYPLLEVEHIGTNPRPPGSTAPVSRRDMRRKILYEKRNGNTYLLTELNLFTDYGTLAEMDDLEYYCVVTVTDGSASVTAQSPVIEAIRWWATPANNLGMRTTHADSIETLVDGENYFRALLGLVNSATSHIYFQGWQTWIDTRLTGEPGGGGTRFSDALLSAAGRGVSVNILLDSTRGRNERRYFDRFVRHANLHVKVSVYPATIPASYHEKYCSIDGSDAVVGGIDAWPDRYQPQGHRWRSDFRRFEAEANARGVRVFGSQFWLWHDAGVKVTGPVVQYIEKDFVRRWNAGEPSGNDLTAPTPSPPRGAYRNVQVVKSDNVSVSTTSVAGSRMEKVRGTKDAYKQAILEARQYIYIENQYFNSTALRSMLLGALNRNPSLQLIVVMPFYTEEAMRSVSFESVYAPSLLLTGITPEVQADFRNRIAQHGMYLQAQTINALRNVQNASDRVGFYSLVGYVRRPPGPEMIYPHSKTMIVDDTWAIIGSANTNGRGFEATDGEINVVIHDRRAVTEYRKSLWQEHLGMPRAGWELPSGQPIDLSTRQIRDFHTIWNATALSGKTKPADCTPAEVGTVHAVKLTRVLPGHVYNGRLDWVPDILLDPDDYA